VVVAARELLLVQDLENSAADRFIKKEVFLGL
jgi:hypothetical protein